MADVQWMKEVQPTPHASKSLSQIIQVVAQQIELEKKRDLELDLLFQ